MELLKDYFGRIGDKACCYEDLLPYVLLDGELASQWTSFLEAVASSYVSLVLIGSPPN